MRGILNTRMNGNESLLWNQGGKTSQVRDIKICGDIRFQTRDFAREWQFVWANFFRFRREKQVIIPVVRLHPWSDNAEDFRWNWILQEDMRINDRGPQIYCTHFVISNVIVRAHSLNLHGTEHPANIVNDFYISRSGLHKNQINEQFFAQMNHSPSWAAAV